jgi:putative ABC transport system substrate-binding protein
VAGFLGIGPASGSASRLAGLRLGMREQGFVEGETLSVDFRWADTAEQLPNLAAELLERNIAVMITGGNSATTAAKAATSTIPILFSTADDPVRLRYVSSFNRPGGNMTGISLISGALGAKRIELLRALTPAAVVIAVLMNPNNPAENARVERSVARDIGQRILVLEATSAEEIEKAFETAAREKVDALLVNADALFTGRRDLLVQLAARHRVPAVYAWREFPEAGGLMSYGTSLSDAYRQLGNYAGRILKGERPGDLPIIQPTTFELVINLKTARSLGLTISPQLLARADEVME